MAKLISDEDRIEAKFIMKNVDFYDGEKLSDMIKRLSNICGHPEIIELFDRLTDAGWSHDDIIDEALKYEPTILPDLSKSAE